MGRGPTACTATETGSTMRRVLERQRVRERIDDALGHGDELGERAVLPVLAAGDAEHAAVAEVDAGPRRQ